MQSHGLPAVVFEQKLIDSTPKSVLFGAVIATNVQQAVYLEQQLTNLPAVSGVESITRFLTEDPAPKLAMIGEIKRTLSAIQFRPPDPNPVKVEELSLTLFSLAGYLGLALDEMGSEEPALAKQFVSLREHIAG